MSSKLFKTKENWNNRVCKQMNKLLAQYRQDKPAEDLNGAEDVVADCSGDEKDENISQNDDVSEVISDDDDEEIKYLVKQKETLEDEKQRLKSDREQRRVQKELRKKQLMQEVQSLEEEIKELSFDERR